MPPLADRQSDFAAALADPTLPVPAGVVGPDGLSSDRRFAVYRNNVAVALSEALAANFPVVRKLVGDEFFKAMAIQFGRDHPPSSPMLFAYGKNFPDVIEEFAPAASLPYLADVARIERAWLDAYHAADANPLRPEALAAIPDDAIAATCFELHPSLRLVRSDFPAVSIWQMNVEDSSDTFELVPMREDALILRPYTTVEVRMLPPGAYEFIDALANGLPLKRAAKEAFIATPEFALSACIRDLVEAGTFVSVVGRCPDDYPIMDN